MGTTGRGAATLVVIDMQGGFRDGGSQWCVPRYEEIVPVITGLQARIAGPAVYTRFVADPQDVKGAWQQYYERWNEMLLPPDAPEWDITLDVPSGSSIISKTTFSKWGPDLAALIPVGGELVLTGVATDCCVLSTALGAVDAGRYVTVIADACAAVSDEAQQQTLALLELLQPVCRVLTSAEYLAAGPVPG
ncbi:MAG: isochorismatase family cysteine hydrolase [Specibacter sp.]